MTEYKVRVLINKDSNYRDAYKAGDRLVGYVFDRPIEASSEAEAAGIAYVIGNGMHEGWKWPRKERSMSVGDVIILEWEMEDEERYCGQPTYEFLLCEPYGWTKPHADEIDALVDVLVSGVGMGVVK